MSSERFQDQVPQRPTEEKIKEMAKFYIDRVKNSPEELKETRQYANKVAIEDLKDWAIGRPQNSSDSYDGWEPDDFVSLLKEMGENVSDIEEKRAEYAKQIQNEVEEAKRPLIHSLEVLMGISHENETDLIDIDNMVIDMIHDPEKEVLVLEALSEGGKIYQINPRGAEKVKNDLFRKLLEIDRERLGSLEE